MAPLRRGPRRPTPLATAGVPPSEPNPLIDLEPLLGDDLPDLVLSICASDGAATGEFVWTAYAASSAVVVPDAPRISKLDNESSAVRRRYARHRRLRRRTRTPRTSPSSARPRSSAARSRRAIVAVVRDVVEDPPRREAATVLLLTEELSPAVGARRARPTVGQPFWRCLAVPRRACRDRPMAADPAPSPSDAAVPGRRATGRGARRRLHRCRRLEPRSTTRSSRPDRSPRCSRPRPWPCRHRRYWTSSDVLRACQPPTCSTSRCTAGSTRSGSHEGLVLVAADDRRVADPHRSVPHPRPGRDRTSRRRSVRVPQRLPGRVRQARARRLRRLRLDAAADRGDRRRRPTVERRRRHRSDLRAGLLRGRPGPRPGGRHCPPTSVAEAVRVLRAQYTEAAAEAHTAGVTPTLIAFQVFGHPRLRLTHV